MIPGRDVPDPELQRPKPPSRPPAVIPGRDVPDIELHPPAPEVERPKVPAQPAGSPRAPVLYLWGKARRQWSGLVNWGICNTASRLPSGALSQHAYCNAIDIHSQSSATMQQVALWAVANRSGLSTARVIYDRRVWSADNPRWRPYRGPHEHRDHVHIDFLPSYGGPLPGVPHGPSFVPGVVLPPEGGLEPEGPAEPVQVAPVVYPQPPNIRPPYDGFWGRRAALLLWAQFGGTMPASPVQELELRALIRRWRAQLGEPASDVLTGSLWARLFGPALGVGSQGRRVVVLHALLHAYGLYAPLPTASRFDSVTLQAVLEVQRRSGVTVDGVVGATTWRAILWGPLRWPGNPLGDVEDLGSQVGALPESGRLVEAWDAHIRVAFEPVGELARKLRVASTSLRRL